MQSSSSRHTISSSNIQSSTFVIRTNGQQSLGRAITKELQAQSSSSVDLHAKQKEELLMRVLMMSFQIERKQIVVKNLIKDIETLEMRNSLSSSDQLNTIKEELTRTKHYAQDLEHKLSQLQISNKQLSLTRNSASKQLEQKIHFIQQRNKELEIRKIQLQQQLHKIITQNKMINFKLVNTESTQKGKNRQMQNIIIELEKKVQEERKISTQLKIIIQTAQQQIKVLRENEQRLCRQFQQRMVHMEKQISHKQDLKRSQAINSQQKIQMTQHQLLRIQQEVKFLRKKLDDQQVMFEKKQHELLADLKKSKDIEAQLFHIRHQNTILKGQVDQRSSQINNLIKELNEARSAYNQLQQSRQLSSIETVHAYQQKLVLVHEEAETYRLRISTLQEEMDRYKNEIRKLKRKNQNNNLTECTSCKILQSASSIKSNKNINDFNLNEIIQQTEKLHDSSLKIQHILSSKRIIIPIGTYESRMSMDNSFVE